MEKMIEVANKQGVTVITVNRPHRRNALNGETRQALTELLNTLARDSSTAAAVIASREAAFSAGQDLVEAKDFPPEHIATWIQEHMDLYRALLSFPRPLIAAVDGCCVGAGFQMALLCDLRIGTPASYFAMPELEDAIPCILGVWTLWDMIGRSRTTEMVLTNRQVHAEEALEWGILNRIASTEELMLDALDLAQQMASKPALAFRLTKERIRLLALQDTDSLAIHAIYAHMTAFASGEPKKAMQKFLDNGRVPVK